MTAWECDSGFSGETEEQIQLDGTGDLSPPHFKRTRENMRSKLPAQIFW